jgi:hypothetical protein
VNVVTDRARLVTSRALTDDPTIEASALRGLWFGLLIAIPFWLLMAALVLMVF